MMKETWKITSITGKEKPYWMWGKSGGWRNLTLDGDIN
jgi:hypothetical protein